MKRALIVVVDAARARICLYQEQAKPGFELTEYKDLANPGRRMKPGEMFSKSGPGAPGAFFDDHRFAHIEEMDSKFAKEIVATVEHVMHEKQMVHLVLCATPKMLGVIRAAGTFLRDERRVDEIARDLSNLSIAALHDHLAGMDMVPPRARLAVAR
jgi:protein required for attachment to host cells